MCNCGCPGKNECNCHENGCNGQVSQKKNTNGLMYEKKYKPPFCMSEGSFDFCYAILISVVVSLILKKVVF